MSLITNAFSSLSKEIKGDEINSLSIKDGLDQNYLEFASIKDAILAVREEHLVAVEGPDDIALIIKMMANVLLGRRIEKSNTKTKENNKKKIEEAKKQAKKNGYTLTENDLELLKEPLIPEKPISELFDEEGLKSIVKNEGMEEHIISVFDRSTHIPKALDGNFKAINLMADITRKTKGITQYDACFGRPFYAQGSAGRMAFQIVFGFVVKIEGKVTSLIDLVVEDNAIMRQGLLNLGFSSAQIDEWVALAIGQQNNPDNWPAPQGQLLWPEYSDETGEASYVALSPMPSCKVYESLEVLSKQISRDNPWHDLHKASVNCGGRKPQNIGSMPNKFNGKMPGLRAKVPKIRSPKGVLERVEAGKSLLRYVTTEAEALKKPLEHFKQRSAYRRYCREYVATLLFPVVDYRNIVRDIDSPPIPRDQIEKDLVFGPKNSDGPKELSAYLCSAIIEKVDVEGVFFNDKKGHFMEWL